MYFGNYQSQLDIVLNFCNVRHNLIYPLNLLLISSAVAISGIEKTR